MEDVESEDVNKIVQVCSLFKAAFKLLEVDTEDVEEKFVRNDVEEIENHSPVIPLQGPVDQGSSNFIQKLVWPHEGVLLLLEEYRKVEYEFYLRRKRYGTLWEEIGAEMRKRSDLNVTGSQCQQKISSLKRTYMSIKENMSNFDAEEWPYYSAVEELFGNKDRPAAFVAALGSGAEGPTSDNDGNINPETSTSDKTFFQWSHQGVLCLLERYKEVLDEFYTGKRRHNKIWKDIAAAVQASCNIKVTGVQCQQKISGMKRTYWGIKETHPCPTANTVPWMYYAAADEIFNKRPRVVIPVTARNTISSVPNRQKSYNQSAPGNSDNSETGVSDLNKKNIFCWSYGGVFILLEKYRDAEHQFFLTNKRHNKIWDEIAEAVHASDSNLKPTASQCQQKISGLKRTYMAIKEHHPCPNEETVSWPYYTAVDEIFGKEFDTHYAGLEVLDSDDYSNSKTSKMYTNSSSKKSAVVWSHEGVCCLLEQFKEAQQAFALGERRHHKIWNDIAEAMKAKSDLKPTGMQCQHKISVLKRIYAAIKENQPSCFNIDKASWPYFPVMDEIFGSSASISVPFACSAGPKIQEKVKNVHSEKAKNINPSSSGDENYSRTGISNVHERRSAVWPHEGILLLLEKYREFEHEFLLGSKLHTKIWEQIAEAIGAHIDLKVTGVQCLQKLCGLKRIYKNIKENSFCPTADTVSWPYFSVVDEMFGENVTRTKHPTIASSSGPDLPHTYINISSSDEGCKQKKSSSIRNKRALCVWPYKGVLKLLEQYGMVKHEFTHGNKPHSQIWNEIAEAMRAVDSSYKVTGVQCQQKICSLKQTYETMKKTNSGLDIDEVAWQYFSAMDSVFGTKIRVVNPAFLYSPSYPARGKRKNTIDSSSSDDETLHTFSPPSKKNKVHSKNIFVKNAPEDVDLLSLELRRKRQKREERRHELEKTKLKEIRAMHEEKMNIQKAALDVLREILSQQ